MAVHVKMKLEENIKIGGCHILIFFCHNFGSHKCSKTTFSRSSKSSVIRGQTDRRDELSILSSPAHGVHGCVDVVL